ncbi:hypothetical protein EV580_6569 [Mycobacterium sp. BK086]|uniref:hypothetical protein n=1 Tax=Mycobacterium sp. BK086 TaxID=2512165 RepID=UPI0010608769|nr:hypothetical protein [Mycobacterium sp. BK086]TDO06478.1 hypothetical protein EV580_6569 [Mycobacterium sp. BK086]
MADVPRELSDLLSTALFESVAVIDPDQLTDDERDAVPDWWLEATQLPLQAGIARAIDQWQTTLPGTLVNLHERLRESGRGIFLGRSESGGKPLLAYVSAVPSGEIVCWYGFPPSPALENPSLDLTKFPTSTRVFYTQLHDGFTLASAFHNGFPASAELFAVGEDLTTDSAEVQGTKPAPNLDELVSLFFDFGASSVCVELDDDSVDRRDGWVVSDAQVQPVDDIWMTIDQWMRSLAQP